MPVLLSLSYSPWSERARWPLDHHLVRYTRRPYQPLLGEPELRLRLRKWTGPVSVPVLIDDDGRAIEDSTAIARWAEAHGTGAKLFPAGSDDVIAACVRVSDDGLACGRALALARLLRDDAGVRELVPRQITRVSSTLATRIGRLGVERTVRKYASTVGDRARADETLDGVLRELRARLAASTSSGPVKTILPSFSYADVAMAQVLVFVAPPAFGVKLGDASRRAFTDRARAEAYADLVAWRDGLYEAHRPRPPARS